MNWENCEEVEANPNIIGGTAAVKGTRVPVAAIFDNLEDGASISEIVEWFPGVTQIKVILRFAVKSSAA